MIKLWTIIIISHRAIRKTSNLTIDSKNSLVSSSTLPKEIILDNRKLGLMIDAIKWRQLYSHFQKK